MDTKVVAIAAILAVVVIAGVAYFAISGDEEDSGIGEDSVKVDFEFDNKAVRLAIGGNANGDDYIDKKDIDTIEKIVKGEIEYDPVMNGYADANNDGKLDASDIEVVKKIIAGDETKLYYWASTQQFESIDFPLKGNVGSHHMYPIDVMIIIGMYDSVKATSHQTFQNSITTDGLRYPGMGTVIKDVGNPWENCEEAVKLGVNVWLDQGKSRDYSTWIKIADNAGLNLQVVRLNITSYNVDSVEMRGTVLMYGLMFQAEEKAHEYVDWVDGVRNYIDTTSNNVNKDWTFLTPMGTNNANEIKLDTIDPNGNMFGDVYTISLTGMKSVNTVANGCPHISMEEIYNLDPSVIVIIMFHTAEASVEDVQNDLNKYADIYKNTNTYKNKNIYGVNYYNIASTAGASELVLLSSYIWSDKFDQQIGWDYLQYYYDHFTMYKDVDVKTMGNALPFQMQPLTA